MLKKFGKYSKWVLTFIVGVGLIAVYKYFDNFTAVSQFFANFAVILRPFIIGFIIAYFLNIPIKYINNLVLKIRFEPIRRHSKSISVLSVYIITVLIITLILRMIIPPLSRNLIELCQSIPIYIDRIIKYIDNFHIDGLPQLDIDKIISAAKIDSYLENIDFTYLNKYAQGVVDITSNVLNIFIGVIISIYMLLDKERIVDFIYRILNALFSKGLVRQIIKYSSRINNIFSKFIYCRVIDAVIIATLASLILVLMKVRYGLVLGIMIGLFNLIPYFGSIVSCVAAIIITIFTGGIVKAVWTTVALVILQQADGNIIGPKLMGTSLNISPLLIIMSVTVGGGLFGIIGMLISVPVVAVLCTVIDDLLTYKEALNRKKQIDLAKKEEDTK